MNSRMGQSIRIAGLLVLIVLSFDTGAADAAESSPGPMIQPQKPDLVVQTGHRSVRSVAFSPDGKLVASGRELYTLAGHKKGLIAQSISSWPAFDSCVAISRFTMVPIHTAWTEVL